MYSVHWPIVDSESTTTGRGQTKPSQLYLRRLSLDNPAKLNFFKTPASAVEQWDKRLEECRVQCWNFITIYGGLYEPSRRGLSYWPWAGWIEFLESIPGLLRCWKIPSQYSTLQCSTEIIGPKHSELKSFQLKRYLSIVHTFLLSIRNRPRGRNSKIRCRKDTFSDEKPTFLPQKSVFQLKRYLFTAVSLRSPRIRPYL